MKEEDVDWLVYHQLPEGIPVTADALAVKSGLAVPEVEASLARLERSCLIERSGSSARLLSFGEALIHNQAKYEEDLPFTIENGVIKEKKKNMSDKDVAILRIGHRPERDQRVTTHVGLTARALGARGMFLAASDKGVVESIADVAGRWGGEFFCEDNVKWRSLIREWKASGGIVVHLTMYGVNLPDVIEEIRPHKKILIIVGAEKVPGDIYGLADFNVAVTGQPHSEISSLALFLDHLFSGTELRHKFPGAQIRIIPSKAGKRTEDL